MRDRKAENLFGTQGDTLVATYHVDKSRAAVVGL
jgi:hypothetical protein